MSDVTASLIGIRDMSGEFSKMLSAKKFCDDKKLSYPKEVQEYFGELVDEDEDTICSEMQHLPLIEISGEGLEKRNTKVKARDCSRNETVCYEFDLSEIPAGLKALRLEMSW